MRMNKELPAGRKRGRAPGPKTDRYQVLLSPELAEWGKQQPGGLSELLRRLLEEARSDFNASSSAVSGPLHTRQRLLGQVVPRPLEHLAEAVTASRSILDLKDDW